MAGRSIATQQFWLQLESVPGTPLVNAMKRYLGLKVMPGYGIEGESYKASGFKVPTSWVPNSEVGQHSVDTIQEFNALTPILTGGFGKPVSTAVATSVGNATEHVYTLDVDGADTKATFTAIWGDNTQAIQMAHFFFNSLGFTIQRGQLTLTTSAMSYAPTTGATLPTGANEVQTVTITGGPAGGTFTLTYAGQTTAGIAYNANAAAVQSALEALSNIAPGDVTVGGGALPTTPVTVTFTGTLAATNVAEMTASGASLTGGTTPAVAVTTTTPGGLTTYSAIPVAARTWDIYADNTLGTIGTTKLLAAYEGGGDFGDKYTPDWVINSAKTSFDSIIENDDLEPSVNLTLGFDAALVSLLGDWTAGTHKYIRMASTGPVIDQTSAPVDINAEIEIDFCVRITEPGEFSAAPNSPAVSLPFTGQIEADDSGFAAAARLVNLVPSL